MERAACRERAKNRHRSVDGAEPLASASIRSRRQETSRVGMLRIPENLAHRTVLDDAAGVHDRDAVGGFSDDAKIVGDEQER